MVKEAQRLNERSDRDKQDYQAQIERLKSELKERFQTEIASKQQE